MSDLDPMKKLSLKSGQSVLVLNPPTGYLERLTGAVLQAEPQDRYDFVQVFVLNSQALVEHFPHARQALKPGGALWLCYPKLSSGIKSDLTRDAGWEVVFQAGLRPVRQVAIDETWSALWFKPGSLEVQQEDPAATQFSGAKAALRPIYDKILAVVSSFGKDIKLTPRQSYIALARKQQFAVLKAGTATRFDLGLRLKNPAPSERLQPAQGLGGGSINYKINLTSLEEVDKQLVEWLKQAYDAA